ncbi:hypothetical protein CVT26_004122 [Gymnopilus dilepis]|uniref:Uncharacterized protein n=1 Tax=Gymnopilus dilepis TaxID=231916 RepID=A0A409WTT8_9AGAR|nr:hypothetical protein CVT26_004122 [Gymnopilus dilepis]
MYSSGYLSTFLPHSVLESYIEAQGPKKYATVLKIANQAGKYDGLSQTPASGHADFLFQWAAINSAVSPLSNPKSISKRFYEPVTVSGPSSSSQVVSYPGIADLCEKAGFLQLALEPMRTLLISSESLSMPQLSQPIDIKSQRSPELTGCHPNRDQGLTSSAPSKLYERFQGFKTFEGFYCYLGSIVNLSEDPEVHFNCHTHQPDMSSSSNSTDQNLLREAKQQDKRPPVVWFNFIHDLILYLYPNDLVKFFEVYDLHVPSIRTPRLIGGLLDVDCDKATIKDVSASVTGNFPIAELVHEAKQRNRLSSRDPAVFNALAKIYFDGNNNPEQFAKENNSYEPLVVGNFCETSGLSVAYVAYAMGFWDEELIAIMYDNLTFKQQARCLQSPPIRALSLKCTDPDNVSLTVKAFLQADLPLELIELFEKIVIKLLGQDRWLHNKLQNYDADDIARIAMEHGLYEEALMLTDLLTVPIPRIDHSHVLNLEAVNEAYNDLPIEEEYHNALQDSIDSFDNLNFQQHCPH